MDAPPKVCQVCSAWIASGVISDLRDLRRVHQLLASSLAKAQSLGRGVYHSGTGLRAGIFSSRMMRLGLQVQQGLDCSNWSRLSRLWLAALQDHALLTLPSQYSSQLPSTGFECGAAQHSLGNLPAFNRLCWNW